jgi:hypothetical protein
MTKAVAKALQAAKLDRRDDGGVALVRRYAQLIDAARNTEIEVTVVSDLGPKLLAALTALGLTAAGRGVKGGGSGVGPVAGKFDELRARRNGAPTVDAAAS